LYFGFNSPLELPMSAFLARGLAEIPFLQHSYSL
jgi:hypothetical protein